MFLFTRTWYSLMYYIHLVKIYGLGYALARCKSLFASNPFIRLEFELILLINCNFLSSSIDTISTQIQLQILSKYFKRDLKVPVFFQFQLNNNGSIIVVHCIWNDCSFCWVFVNCDCLWLSYNFHFLCRRCNYCPATVQLLSTLKLFSRR